MSTTKVKIHFYSPAFFKHHYSPHKPDCPGISITGWNCNLNCKHCNGVLLRNLIPATTPKRLMSICEKLVRDNVTKCLLTGGSNPDGTLPWLRYADCIKKVKHSLNLKFAIHSGLIDLETASILKKAGVAIALIDLVGSDRTAEEVLHLTCAADAFEKSLANLVKVGFKVVPHIVLGLHCGKIVGEYDAIDMAAKYNPPSIVFVVFTPLPNTPFHNKKPPLLAAVEDVLKYGCAKFSPEKIIIGCMRPRGKYAAGLEKIAIANGIRKIAVPSENTILCVKKNYEIVFHNYCCAFD